MGRACAPIHGKSRMRRQTVPQIVDRTFVDTWLSGLHVATDSRPDICGTGHACADICGTAQFTCSI